MSSAEFRQISMGSGRRDGDRLFSAAISAFCSIARPTRHDADQLEDLIMPLFRQASEKTLRFASASLSECKAAPIGLVRALCHQNAEICAPLLVRYEGFTEADIIVMISRYGIPHARIIAHRKRHHPVVRDLLIALGNEEITALLEGKTTEQPGAVAEPAHNDTSNETGRAEQVRSRLRSMLAQSGIPETRPTHIGDEHIRLREKLRSTAFLENPAFFQTTLADALAIDFRTAKAITETGSWQRLAIALKALNIPDPDAFLLAFTLFPALFTSRQTARNFVEHYQGLSRETSRREAHSWAAAPSDADTSQLEDGDAAGDQATSREHEAANGGNRLRRAS